MAAGSTSKAKPGVRGRDKAKGTGNCAWCDLCVIVRSNGISPRHGHLGTGRFFKPCPGSGKPAKWVLWLEVT